MHPFGSYLATRPHLDRMTGNRDAEIAAMYRRPDAEPLPPEPERPGRLERILANIPVLRGMTTHRV
jgi:hypothetical protein